MSGTLSLPDLSLPSWWTLYVTNPTPSRKVDPLRILRPHWESAVTDGEEQDWRWQSDQWLDRIAMVELLIATGNLDSRDLRPEINPCLDALVHPAVQRYIDDYDCFAARFLLARFGDVRGFLPPLPRPPYPLGAPFPIGEFREQQGRFAADKTMQQALNILDDFVYGPSIHKTALREWLELPAGSRAEAESTLPFIAVNLRRWIDGKASTYHDAKNSKVCARYAVYDFYWLTQLFDCAISTTGRVRWNAERGAKDWFDLLGAKPDSKSQLRDAWVQACQWIQGTSQEEPERILDIVAREGPVRASTPPVTWNDVKSSIGEAFSLLGKRLRGANHDAR